MGKAPVDLPDPLEQPTPAPGAGADDLLSQLAGDEIDRLLAEADRAPGGPEMRREETPLDDSAGEDEEPVAAFPGAPAEPDLLDDAPPIASMPAAEAVMEEIAETAADVSNQLDQLFAQLDEKSPAAAKADPAKVAAITEPPAAGASVNAAAAIGAAEKQISAQELDQAISQAAPVIEAEDEADAVPDPTEAVRSEPSPAPETPPALAPAAEVEPAPTAARSPAAEPATAALSAAKTDPVAVPAVPPKESPVTATAGTIPASAAAVASVVEAETSAAERSLLDTALGIGEDESEAKADLSDIDDLPPAVPIYLKPLVWFNAPFAALSDNSRESLGKVAVVTMVNAVAVLLYVLIFRNR